MCRHEAEPLFKEPTDAGRKLVWLLKGLDGPRVCTKCHLTGHVTLAGNLRWCHPGTVGFEGREKTLAEAGAWNAVEELPAESR